MFNYVFSRYGKLVAIILAPSLLFSCSRILTPDQTSEVTEVRAGQYVLDPNHASLIWKLNHLGFSTFIGTFNEFEASLDFDPEDIENASLEVVINTSSLDVDIPEFEEELRGDNWFDVAVFPQAVYRTTRFVESVDEDTFLFEGDLTLLGTVSYTHLTLPTTTPV